MVRKTVWTAISFSLVTTRFLCRLIVIHRWTYCNRGGSTATRLISSGTIRKLLLWYDSINFWKIIRYNRYVVTIFVYNINKSLFNSIIPFRWIIPNYYWGYIIAMERLFNQGLFYCVVCNIIIYFLFVLKYFPFVS